YRLSLPLDFELSTPRDHVVDLVLGVRRLMIGFPCGEAVDACAEHPRAQELPPLIACGACCLDDLVELNGQVVRLGHRRMVCRLVGNDVDDGRCSFRVKAEAPRSLAA